MRQDRCQGERRGRGRRPSPLRAVPRWVRRVFLGVSWRALAPAWRAIISTGTCAAVATTPRPPWRRQGPMPCRGVALRPRSGSELGWRPRHSASQPRRQSRPCSSGRSGTRNTCPLCRPPARARSGSAARRRSPATLTAPRPPTAAARLMKQLAAALEAVASERRLSSSGSGRRSQMRAATASASQASRAGLQQAQGGSLGPPPAVLARWAPDAGLRGRSWAAPARLHRPQAAPAGPAAHLVSRLLRRCRNASPPWSLWQAPP
jgi:hypothetical protein